MLREHSTMMLTSFWICHSSIISILCFLKWRHAIRADAMLRWKVPLEIGIRETSDAGTPIVASQPDSPTAQVYCDIADRLRHKLRLVEPQSGPRRDDQKPP